MSSPEQSSSPSPPRASRSYSALAASLPHHEDPPLTLPLRGALASLIQARSVASAPTHTHHPYGHYANHHSIPPLTPERLAYYGEHQDYIGQHGSGSPGAAGDMPADDTEGEGSSMRRPVADERLSEIINGPQMRSLRLIGKSNPRYQWERYWKTAEELKKMSKGVREYYERTNNLIQQYLFIDHLLDSSRPYDILNEYEPDPSLERDPVAPASGKTIPIPIAHSHGAPALPSSSSNGPDGQAAGRDKSPLRTVPENGSYGSMTTATMAAKKVKRTPREIFSKKGAGAGTEAGAASEATPLLQHQSDDGAVSGDVARPTSSDSNSSTIITAHPADLEAAAASSTGLKTDVDDWLVDGEIDSQSSIVTIAIWVNFVANAVLLAAKIIVIAWVPSMSVLASLVDAALDFLSTVIVWLTTKLISKSQHDQYHYPVGRRRLEPLGVLVFSVVMITSFFQVAIQCFERLASSEHELIELGGSAIGIMASTVVIKGVVWVYYRLVKNSSVRALADDAKTDVIFNLGSILFPIVGFYAGIWWLDALGGMLLSFVVIFNWSSSCLVHVRNLSGFSAQPDERNLLLYLTMRFATSIRQIQNLRAYHAGDKLFVEADIVLDPTTPLRDSHDLGEVLTYFLESVPFVDRAFVHIDYASYHAPTHLLQGDDGDET